VCSMEFGEYGGIDSEVLEALSGSARLTHVTNCEHSKSSENGMFSSVHLQGNYPSMCPLGDTFASCAGDSNNGQCSGNDLPFSFRGRIGKVMRVPKNEQDAYEVSFNDGRTFTTSPSIICRSRFLRQTMSYGSSNAIVLKKYCRNERDSR
jgi:hypothetical protein